MAPLVAEGRHHEVRGAVHDRCELSEARDRIDKAAEANAANYLVEIADSRLKLGEQVDGAEASSFLTCLRRDLSAEFALVGVAERAVEAVAELARDDDEIAGPNE